MRFVARHLLAPVFAFAMVVGPACGNTTTSGTQSQPSPSLFASTSPSATAASTGTGTGKLDQPVATPSTFPSDFPVYPGARLTQASVVTANGQTTFGMKWQTLDSVEAVQAFYSTKLNQGDWMLTYNGSSNGKFSAIFSRRSNQKDAGIFGVELQSGVTDITLAFGMPT